MPIFKTAFTQQVGHSMNILFVSVHLIFNVSTPEHEPLGGSESCFCYLASALAARGHNVTAMMNAPLGTPEVLMGVRHVSPRLASDKAFFEAAAFDVIVYLNMPDLASGFKAFSPDALHVSWMHGLPNQQSQGSHVPLADCSIYLSRSHHAAFSSELPAYVIGNGIAPAFENLFASAKDLYASKLNRGAYTSTPYRGLELLVIALERLQMDTDVDIYSSMRIYQMPDTPYTELYNSARRNPSVRYRGAVAQPVLARHLRATAFLFYPCIFPETYCLAAAEALAAGLEVISSDYGALKETTMGHATLLSGEGKTRDEYLDDYCALMKERVVAFKANPRAWAERRFQQSQDVSRNCSWTVRAKEWEEVLATAIRDKAA